jgi:uncharacterized protein
VTPVIVDTSAILAIFDESYTEHAAIAGIVSSDPGPFVVSPMVVSEADYMLHSRLGADAARLFATEVFTQAYELAEWAVRDQAAAIDVSRHYGRDKDYIGITDASNVVLADRYRTTRMLTLDQRHFRMLRPLWGAGHFTLLPYDA